MATYTQNLDLKKPAQSDKIRIADINNNMDTIDGVVGDVGERSIAAQIGDVEGALAIVSTGNVHGAITSGQYVYIKNHDTLDDGLYVATTNISANGTLSSSNVTADSAGGGLNALNGKIDDKKVTQLYYNGSLNLEQGTEITLSDSVRNYDILILEMYASVSGGGGTRKFSTVALKPYITNDDGGLANYIEASVFYSSSYNAGIGFTTNGNKITVAEVNKTGYPYIKGITVYGIKLS